MDTKNVRELDKLVGNLGSVIEDLIDFSHLNLDLMGWDKEIRDVYFSEWMSDPDNFSTEMWKPYRNLCSLLEKMVDGELHNDDYLDSLVDEDTWELISEWNYLDSLKKQNNPSVN